MRKSKPLIYSIASPWHLDLKFNVMEEVNFKAFLEFYDFLASIRKRRVKVVRSRSALSSSTTTMTKPLIKC